MLDLLLQQMVNGITTGMAYALVALGLTMIFGVLHVINFAHGEFYMLGGLAAVLATMGAGLPYPVGVALAVLSVTAVAWAVDRLAVRPILDRPDGPSTVLLSSFAISLLIQQSVLTSWGPNPARIEAIGGALEVGTLVVTHQRLAVILAGLALLVATELILRRTALGRQIRAVAQSAYAARVVGIDVARIRTMTFLGAAALAGVTGALVAPVTLFTPAMGQHAIVNAFVIVVLGGMGSAAGAVLCGLTLGVLEALASVFVAQEVGTAIIYALLLAALLVRPQGLFGTAAR